MDDFGEPPMIPDSQRMSDEDLVANFACYHSGRFIKAHGHEYYDGGFVRFLNKKKPSELFNHLMNELPISMIGQRVWYKLPFEGQEERKAMSNGDANFKKMCLAATWTKSIDIFVEPYYDGAVSEEANNNEEDFTEESRDNEEVRNAAGFEESGQFEEEIRVERIVASFGDLDDEYDEYATPVESSDEDNGTDDYVRYVKGSGELKFKQIFDSLEAFKNAIVEYVLKTGRNVKYGRWEKDKSEAVCASGCAREAEGEGANEETEEETHQCLWRIYCSYETTLEKWMVKVYNDDHICMKTGYSKILTQEVIAKLFVNDIRDNPKMKPKQIQKKIQDKWSLIATDDQCRKAKKRALEMLQEEHDEQYSRLKDYRIELLDSNEDSTVELETFTVDGGLDIFHRFYVCFGRIKKAWRNYSRPIFGLDGCFLKCFTDGQLLAAVGRDSNNQMYPLAWAIVDKENEDNWKWFISLLQTDLNLQDGSGFTLISDRQKGLLIAVSDLLPHCEHRMCARHIYANLKKDHPRRADMKGLFWKVAKSYNSAQYEKSIEKLKMYDMSVYDSVMKKNPKNCSLAFFKPTASCDDVSNNINESFNNAINPTREMPLVEMLETIRRRAMVRIDIRRNIAKNHKGKFTLKAVEKLELEQKKIKNCSKAYPAGPGEFEVKEKNSGFKVHMGVHSCTCRRWDMSGIPCRHALKVISDKKLNQENYISSWYLTSRWRNEYDAHIDAVRGVNFWTKSGETELLPPPRPTAKGRKPVPKRIKERNESPPKKKSKGKELKVSREKRIVHCGRCGIAGHNTRKCQNTGVKVKRPPKKGNGITVEERCIESSQPTQSQVID